MDNYQFGNQLSFAEVLKDKNKYVEIFSEGDKHLKKLLKFCFDNNIETNLCCKGHSEEQPMYIKFNINRNKLDNLYRIIKAAVNNSSVVLEFCKRANDDYASLWLVAYDFSKTEKIFNDLYHELKQHKQIRGINLNLKHLLTVVKNFNYPNYDLTLATGGYGGISMIRINIEYVEMEFNQILSRFHVFYKMVDLTTSPLQMTKEIDQQIAIDNMVKIKSLKR